jgi:Ca-activated chloride channel family protein
MMTATKDNITKALAAVDQIEASGGTNIDGALRAALGSDFTEGAATAKMIVFMTDGLPTNGVTDMGEILRGVKDTNKKSKVRFFNFGVGDDVNTHLLDQLALDQDGTSTYVSPREDIEIKVSDFFAKVKNPVMTDAFFDFGTASGANSIYPKKIPALFKGGEFVLTGRYKGSGLGEIVLTGNVGGESKRIAVKVDWSARSLDNSFLPRVWAMRKIGYLLESMRLNGQNPEIVKEIVELATRHGIVTPYTSQLVLEPGMPGTPMPVTKSMSRGGGLDRDEASHFRAATPASTPMEALQKQDAAKKETLAEAGKLGGRAREMETGENATALAAAEKDLKDASGTFADKPAAKAANGTTVEEQRFQYANAMNARRKADGSKYGAADALYVEQAQASLIKNVGSRTFYSRGGVWVDSQAKADAKLKVVKQFSQEYFDLLKGDAEMGAVLALGGKILVASGAETYQIEE